MAIQGPSLVLFRACFSSGEIRPRLISIFLRTTSCRSSSRRRKRSRRVESARGLKGLADDAGESKEGRHERCLLVLRLRPPRLYHPAPFPSFSLSRFFILSPWQRLLPNVSFLVLLRSAFLSCFCPSLRRRSSLPDETRSITFPGEPA